MYQFIDAVSNILFVYLLQDMFKGSSMTNDIFQGLNNHV